jgi:dihydrolipoamide dehydrogenase
VAAIRAAQLEMKTALVEKARLGGMCLNWGCVPSRRFMESARLFERMRHAGDFGITGFDPAALRFDWKKAVADKDRIVTKLVKGVEYLMKKNKITVLAGEATLTGDRQVTVGDASYAAAHVILATGARPDVGPVSSLVSPLVVEVDELFARGELPERLVIAGGDTVACETASMMRLIGKEVTLVVPGSQLMPWLDESLVGFIADKFKRQGIRMLFDSRITGPGAGGVQVGEQLVECDLVINCSNRKAVLPPLEDVPLDLDNGFARINEYCQTSVPGVYAVGDVTGQIFAHVASAQGVCAVNHIGGLKEPIDYARMPVTLYLEPEIGSVGLTETQVRDREIDCLKGEFPMSVNSKAIVEGATEGFVKVLADRQYGEVLGVHVVASRATDLISEAVMCMRTEGTLEDLARAVHAHPTISETVPEAGFKAMGKPLHV